MQQLKRLALIGVALLTLTGPGLARPDEPQQVVQTSFSASVVCRDPQHLASVLNDLVQKHHGTVQNFSMDQNSTSGSAGLRLPPAELSGFINELGELGRIENQNVSTSDYTSTVRDYTRRLTVYRQLSQAPLDNALSSLDPQQRSAARSELQQMINERIQSYESNLQSYTDNSRVAQVSLNFRCPPVEQPPQALTQKDEPRQERPAPPPPPRSNSLPLYLLGFVNLGIMLMIYRRLLSGGGSNSTPASPPPGVND